MPDLMSEPLLPVNAATGFVPAFKGTHRSTLHRWVHKGVVCNGVTVKLEAVRIGGIWKTSVEALKRFAAATTNAAPVYVAPPRSQAATRKAGEAAGRELAKLGA